VSLADLRREYASTGLSESDLDPDPVRQFRRWLQQALDAGLAEPNAMTLATATRDGAPSARVVLLKGLDERGFTFFTSYHSRKARELDENPRASLLFYWVELARQVRVEGTAARVSDPEADAYFATRPRGNQLGAWASARQSEVVPDRTHLEESLARHAEQFLDRPVPRPPYWGGYRLRPAVIEFWQGRASRLHDRLRYTFVGEGQWRIERLSP
jgi:pyridoxamine 5'-phosphate oxidase